MSDPNESTSTIDDDRALLSSEFLEFSVKLRNNDPSILPELGKPLKIRHMCEREHIDLSDALLENNNVTYLELATTKYTKSSAEAMAKYLRTSNSACNAFTGTENGVENCSIVKRYSVVFCLEIKKARRSRNYT
jgi:hypothetical protein